MNKKKYIILGIVLILILSIGSTFAWYVWRTSDDEVKKISASLGAARVVYNEGSDISADIMPVATKEEGVIKDITVKALDNTSYNLSFNLYLDIIEMDDIFKHESFRYAIYKDGSLVKEGDFTEGFKTCTVNNTTHLVLVEGERITTSKSTYTLYLWIDGVNYTNPSEMQRKNIKLKLHASGENAILMDGSVYTPINAVQHITNLYNEAEKIEVINNDIPYNYATSVSLMNDGLGYGAINNWGDDAPFTDSAGCYDYFECSNFVPNIFPDELTCEAELPSFMLQFFGVESVDTFCENPVIDGNIRYYGANPSNYIDIGDVFTEDTTVNNWEKFGVPSQEACYDELDCSVNYGNLGFEDENSCNEHLSEFLEAVLGVSTIDEVCGTTVYSAGETKSLYRIIGVFKDMELADGTTADLVKVVRDSSIGPFSWDTSSSDVNNGKGINEWSQADIMKLLNPGFETNTAEFGIWNEELGDLEYNVGLANNSLWWNSGAGFVFTLNNNEAINSNFNSNGLSSNVHNKIASVVWNLGAYNDRDVYPNQIYGYERGENEQVESGPPVGPSAGPSSSLPAIPLAYFSSDSLPIPLANYYEFDDGITRTSEWTGKVALMYPSDIGYAADFNVCDVQFSDYNNDCINSNYLAQNESCLLTPNFDEAFFVWGFFFTPPISDVVVSYDNPVLPTFYLKADTVITSGNGSKSKPYKVG